MYAEDISTLIPAIPGTRVVYVMQGRADEPLEDIVCVSQVIAWALIDVKPSKYDDVQAVLVPMAMEYTGCASIVSACDIILGPGETIEEHEETIRSDAKIKREKFEAQLAARRAAEAVSS